ncbi:MAG: hypothetical protein U1E43_00135 [Rhodospirillales bacterium]
MTPFALINDAQAAVRVVLDAEDVAADILNFHPLANTATTAISPTASSPSSAPATATSRCWLFSHKLLLCLYSAPVKARQCQRAVTHIVKGVETVVREKNRGHSRAITCTIINFSFTDTSIASHTSASAVSLARISTLLPDCFTLFRQYG